MEPKDPNETVSVRPPRKSKAKPEFEQPEGSAASASREKRPPRQTASANPISSDDLLQEPDSSEDDSWVPMASAFAVGLVAGLIAGILIGRD